MYVTKIIITKELISIYGWYLNEKEILKKEIDDIHTDSLTRRKLLSKVSLYNIRITTIKESIHQLKKEIKLTNNLKLTDWQLN
ncbi:MAG: hypothetical protein ACXVNN_02930 [Bacteroidia bacterium]